MYSLNQEKPWYLTDEWYVTVEEFDAIRRMNFPKDFIDFFEIAFRTGLHEKDILNLKKENITLVKDENNNIVSGRIYGNSIKFKTPINVKLDQKSLSILTKRMENTKIEFLFVNELNHPYFQEYFYKAFEQLYPDKEIRKHMCSIRAGNLKFLESHNVKYFEIKFRQRMNTHDPVHFYMEDQSASVNAIDKHLK